MFNNLFTGLRRAVKAAETLALAGGAPDIFGRPAGSKMVKFGTGVVETGVVL
jgi:hypothetical protein